MGCFMEVKGVPPKNVLKVSHFGNLDTVSVEKEGVLQ
jgi:hypothetical protein